MSNSQSICQIAPSWIYILIREPKSFPPFFTMLEMDFQHDLYINRKVFLRRCAEYKFFSYSLRNSLIIIKLKFSYKTTTKCTLKHCMLALRWKNIAQRGRRKWKKKGKALRRCCCSLFLPRVHLFLLFFYV